MTEKKTPLNPADGYKPLDFGYAGVTGSVNQDGRIIAINTYHPEQGYVTLTSAPPFSEADRYNPVAVRAYRKSLAQQDGYGLKFNVPIVKREAFLLEDAIPCIRLTLENGIIAQVITFVPPESAGVVQFWEMWHPEAVACFSGKLWLRRCDYTQLTEGGVLAIPSSETKITYQQNFKTGLENADLKLSAHLSLVGCSEDADGSIIFNDSEWRYPHINPLSRSDSHQHDFAFVFSEKSDFISGTLALGDFFYAEDLLHDALQVWNDRWQGVPDDKLLRRGLVYGLSCCIPVNAELTCIITDHMLLPLSWNRDAYYVARALMNWLPEGRDIMRRHLIWMFETAERVNGFWGRSYLANGKVKDKGFQLDQQLFPLLELAEYILETHDSETLTRLTPHIDPLIHHLLGRQSGALFSTDETSADDPIAYPYALSSHLLMWHTCHKLAALPLESAVDFSGMAESLREAVGVYFTAEHMGKTLYAYATDGQGNHHFYHDANDMPLAFAPAWGLVSADDPVWLATVDFAFSEANKGGFYGGGLGSVHTPAPWALGDIQHIIIARAIGDTEREATARARLQKAAQWDGALPEAYHAETFEVVSRHWFAWTNAMLGCIEKTYTSM